jgi:SET domain-containing protein
MGSFAVEPIAQGEVVIVWAHAIIDVRQAGQARDGQLYVRADGQYIWQPDSWVDLDGYDPAEEWLNHSCDPNVWMDDEVTLAARRDISAGEELTGDYALWELDPAWICPFGCNCGSHLCRHRITGRDWELPELQRRYAGHWHPVIEARIAELAV